MLTTVPPPPAALAQLHRLLDAGQSWSATYGAALSNHLPMAQQALLELGASSDRLQAFTTGEAARLERGGPAVRLSSAVMPELGCPASDAAWRAYFAARIDALGWSDALREALPLLLPGVGAIAFHGLIRTSHAVLARHPGELAAGLAHWASHFMNLPLSAATRPVELAAWLRSLAALRRPAHAPEGPIAERMRAWGQMPGFVSAAGELQQSADTLRELALLAARTYASTRNFTILHLLTASHAMAVLEPWWPAPELCRSFSVAAAAGLLASGAAPTLALDRGPSRPWPHLIAAVIVQDDAHVIKLAHAAWRLDRRWPDPAWRCAVERSIPV